MIKSMTGFGRGKVQGEEIECSIEIKSVNHRYRELFLKLPRQLTFLEDKFRDKISNTVSRGKIEVFVTYQGRSSSSTEVILDHHLAASYVKALRELQLGYQLTDDISVSLLSKFPDVMKLQPKEINENQFWKTIEIALEEALESLGAMRVYEGEKLAQNLKNRIENITEYMNHIQKKAPFIPKEYERKLTQRIEEILEHQGVDQNRLAMEVALFADRCNIDEEIERMKSHTEQFVALLKDKDAVGRKLDFLVQEMNREVNTIGSKANDTEIVKFVVELKSEVEKLREQIQNIE
jgi:uncharacterized protein (TIGR00255 family)